MTKNPYLVNIDRALRSSRELGVLFERMGTKGNETGYLYAGFETARMAVDSALSRNVPDYEVVKILLRQRDVMAGELQSILLEADELGYESAVAQLREYGIEIDEREPVDMEIIESAVLAVMSRMDAQISAVNALLKISGDREEILGDSSRLGVLRVSDILTTGAVWIASTYWDKFQRISRKFDFEKQAVATMDNRVTDCCLRVHGQHIKYKKKFTLTGTPRFADKLFWTPFHWWCRTSIVLYNPVFEDGTTERMKQSAKRVMQYREDGKPIINKPYNAFFDG